VLAGIKGVFIDRDPAVLDRLFSADYRQHNPQIPNGTARDQGAVEEPAGRFQIRARPRVADGDYVAIHGRYLGWAPSYDGGRPLPCRRGQESPSTGRKCRKR